MCFTSPCGSTHTGRFPVWYVKTKTYLSVAFIHHSKIDHGTISDERFRSDTPLRWDDRLSSRRRYMVSSLVRVSKPQEAHGMPSSAGAGAIEKIVVRQKTGKNFVSENLSGKVLNLRERSKMAAFALLLPPAPDPKTKTKNSAFSLHHTYFYLIYQAMKE